MLVTENSVDGYASITADGENVVLRLNVIYLHAHQLIGLEWSVGVATQGLLPQDIGGGASREKRFNNQPV